MNLDSKKSFLQKTIAEMQGGDVPNFTEDTLLSDLNLDSLDIVELQMAYEDEMNVTIDDPDTPILTVGDLLQLMK
jgi:acyl carrier protein